MTCVAAAVVDVSIVVPVISTFTQYRWNAHKGRQDTPKDTLQAATVVVWYTHSGTCMQVRLSARYV